MSRIVRFFKKQGVKRVLDMGCGAGKDLVFLAKNGFEVFGIDIAPEGLKFIKAQLKKFKLKSNFKVGNVFDRLPFQSNFFDAVISVQVLQHGKVDKIKKAIKEIERVLRPGGFVFITLCGRLSKGKVRYCLVKTAKKIAPHTYVPQIGNEKGLVHFIYNKNIIKEHYNNFKIVSFCRDDKDYYCFLAQSNKKV